MGLIKEFREFALKGSAIDLAVGVIIGAAFAPVVKSLVDDIIMPPIGWAIGRVDFSKLSLAIPVPAGDPVQIMYGRFLNAVIAFTITAFAIFLIIKVRNQIFRQLEETPKPTKTEELLTEILTTLKARG